MASTLLPPPVLDSPQPRRSARAERAARDQEILLEAFNPRRLSLKTTDWVVFAWMTFIHAGALAAPFFFSWSGLALAVGLHFLTASVGICLGYHRFLSHRALKLRTPAEFFVLLCGSLSGEGTPLNWSATHRRHHQLSDQPGDPHSPLDGPWWSHLLWLFLGRSREESKVLYERYCPELLDRPMLKFFERAFPFLMWGSALTLFAVGWAVGGSYFALSYLLWGLCVRMTVAYHSTWFVNSATHLWGYRNYETRDQSRNLWWVALLAYGEGWHNNHHAHPSVAPAGHRWWEFDVTWNVIRLMRLVGLAYDVRDRIPAPGAKPEEE